MTRTAILLFPASVVFLVSCSTPISTQSDQSQANQSSAPNYQDDHSVENVPDQDLEFGSYLIPDAGQSDLSIEPGLLAGHPVKYVSHITNLDKGGLVRAYTIEDGLGSGTFVLKVNGDKVVGSNFDKTLVINGVIKGNKIEFEVEPGHATLNYRYTGVWEIRENGALLAGKWRHPRYQTGGDWNMQLFENQIPASDQHDLDEEGVVLYTIKTGITAPFRVSNVDSLLDQVLSTDEGKNIVFYLHGWGTSFYSLFEPSSLPSFENYTDTVFVIVRWPAWEKYLGRPYEKAINSSSDLAKLFNALDKYKTHSRSKIGNRKITLLAHSMGNITLQGFMEKFYEDQSLQQGLLDNLVISSADVPLKNHKSWVEKVDFAENIYITQHRGDMLLRVSDWFLDHPESQGSRLGTGFKGSDGRITSEISNNSQYLDLTEFTIRYHMHFKLSPAQRDGKIAQLYKLLLNGNRIEFPSPDIGLTEKHDSLPIFYFYNEELNDPALSEKK